MRVRVGVRVRVRVRVTVAVVVGEVDQVVHRGVAHLVKLGLG